MQEEDNFLTTTANENDVNATFDELYNQENIETLSDTAGMELVAAGISSNGDLATVLSTPDSILVTVQTYIWNIIKRVQEKLKSWMQYIVDLVQQYKLKTLLYNTGSNGGGA